MSTAVMPSPASLEDNAVSSPDRSASKAPVQQESPTNQSKNTTVTDHETLSTANCDDSLTASTMTAAANVNNSRLYYAPPVAAVNVDRRDVRQRLRDQEAKINALLHHHKPAAAASENVLLQLVQTLEADLKKTQDEKQGLQKDLERLQRQQSVKEEEEEEVEETTVETTTDMEAMTERMARLEVELRHKTHESSLLQDRWETTLRRMVEYQVDLETHDLHYTDYAAQQAQAGQDALDELNDMTASKGDTRKMGKRAKRMMSTLLQDLEGLGDRYTDARVHQEQQVADLRIAQMEWQRRAAYLEAVCQEHNIEVEEQEERRNGILSGPLMKFHQKLRLQQTAFDQTKRELEAQAQASKQEASCATLERDVLQKEVQRLQQTVSQLQETTQTQQEQLQAANDQKKQKKKGLFWKKKQTPPPPMPPVDVAAALAPLQGESQRFDMLHERLQAQAQALQSLQQEHHRVAGKKAQLAQTVTDLRMEQEQVQAAHENHALQVLQEQWELQRTQEQLEAQATIAQLRAQLAAALEPKKDYRSVLFKPSPDGSV